ncbi:MAG: GNAT family N-acetyltransferase [Gemmatimonadota bacterium]
MSAYRCVRHGSPEAFLTRAESWLLENEAEHNLILGIAAQLKGTTSSNAYFATLEHDEQIVGCAFRTPPYKLGVTRMPLGAVQPLIDDATSVFDDIPAVLGPETVASAVADGIARKRGRETNAGMRQRIYELHRVMQPSRMPAGRLRLAQPADHDVLREWLSAFATETNHGPADARAYAQAHIANKTVFVWDDDGPKSTALWAGITPHGVRIGFVYTPPEHRGRGHASAVTAGASARALDSGYAFCCLYTDLANRTSNAIYQQIGYRAVCDVVDYTII